MNYVSCFSGIEAASVASHDLGWAPVAFSEIDNFASAVLAHHYPKVPNLGDITKIDWSEYNGRVGLVCGGSPCQAFSLAGLRKSLEDPRGNLTLEYMRAVHAIKPKWVVWEQVPGVFSASGNPFGCFVAGLAGYDTPIEPPNGKWGNSGFLVAKDEGSYSLAWRVLCAQHFGVPQRRRRIFLVGHLGIGCWWKPLEVLLERHRENGHPSQGRKAREEVAEDVGRSVEAIDGQAMAVGSHWDDPKYPHPTLSQSLKSSGGVGASNQEIFGQRSANLVPVGYTPSSFGKYVEGCGTLRAQGGDCGPGSEQLIMAHGQGGAEIREGQARCLTCNHEAPILFDVHSQDSRVTGPHETSPTVVGKWGTGGGNTPLAVCTGGDVARTLTARNDGSPCTDRGPETVAIAFAWQGGTQFHATEDDARTLTKSQTEAVAFAQNQEGELRTSETMHTLGTTQNASGRATGKVVVPLNTMTMQGRPSDDANPRMGNGIGKPGDPCPTLTKGHSHAVQQGYTVRRITPVEAEFLQGFPRNWTQIPYRGKPAELCPDGPRYKALGNSWAVPVARWVFERIDKVDKL